MNEGQGKPGLIKGLVPRVVLWPSMKTMHQELKKL
jgi:hypothetical protein